VKSRSADFERLSDLLNDKVGLLGNGVAAAPRAHEAAASPGTVGSPRNPPTAVDCSGVAGDVARALASTWAEAVGEEIAANTRPVQFRQGRLAVSASSSAWAQTLQLMAEAIGDRLNERLGGTVVREVVFRHAGWEQGWEERRHSSGTTGIEDRASAGMTSASRGATAEEEHAIAEIRELRLEPALEDSILRAMLASLRRS
jgi:hypothetical protein